MDCCRVRSWRQKGLGLVTRRTNAWLQPGELSSHTAEALIDRIAAARDRVWLASPFVSDYFAKRICDRLPSNPELDIRLLVALNGSGVESGTLNLSALRRLRAAGFILKNVTNLHAKVSIVDADWGLVGSGNLTKAGQKATNVELGVVLYPQQHAQARSMFEAWWYDAQLIELGDIAAFEKWRKQLPSRKSNPPPPKHGKPIRVPEHSDENSNEEITGETGFWVKAMYYRRNHEDTSWWRQLDRVHDAPRRPKGGPKYRVGDRLVIYLRETQTCPAIVRVTAPARFDPTESNKGLPEYELNRWPWLTRVEMVASRPLEDAIPKDVLEINPLGLQNGRKKLRRDLYELAEIRLR